MNAAKALSAAAGRGRTARRGPPGRYPGGPFLCGQDRKISVDKISLYMYNVIMENKINGVEVLKALAQYLECDWRDLEAALLGLVKMGPPL